MYNALLILGLACSATSLWGGPPTPFLELFNRSEIILVGSIGEGEPAMDPAVRQRTAATGVIPGQPVYGCKFALHISAVIKVQAEAITSGATVPLIWYLPSPGCQVYWFSESVMGPSLFLLRVEDGFFRPVTDNIQDVQPLLRFTAEDRRELLRWRDPKLALAYLFLTPGITVGAREYAMHENVPAVDLVGWTGFLEIYRSIFAHLQPAIQDQICLTAAQYGMCLTCAEHAIKIGRVPHGEEHRFQLLDDVQFRRFGNRETERLAIDSESQLLKTFSTLSQAKDELTMYACSSSERVRTEARKTLERFFQVAPSTLPCIPCENITGR